jgi:hypothetical protein
MEEYFNKIKLQYFQAIPLRNFNFFWNELTQVIYKTRKMQ